ncbi:hypothetical protein LSG31_15665 [Fodinisporobacter ferrooxydans]|uniref:Uncharacterized protein n=1 Tax=Fodinisporobacter ferrooxydans TaxID=2901836 RepID=A0ABY4CH40_9BACL|nr:hypothetical protein LSG31_15665 [Alicyclobacillaceae bacterium MYW30-H2]
MSAKNNQYILSSKEMEELVKQYIQDAFQGDFFKSMFAMRDQQLERVKDLQQKAGNLDSLAFWDLVGTGDSEQSNGMSASSSAEEQENPDLQQMDEMAERLQQQIHSFVARVLAKSNPSHDK